MHHMAVGMMYDGVLIVDAGELEGKMTYDDHLSRELQGPKQRHCRRNNQRRSNCITN